MSDIARLKEKVKKDVRSLLISDPNGLTVQGLQNDYVNLCGGKPLPFRELGYSSITDFINDSPDVIRICYDRGRQILRAVGNESTAKIEKMVALQKNSKKRKSFAPSKPSSYFNRQYDFRSYAPLVNLKPCVTAYVRTEVHKLLTNYPNGIESSDFCIYYYETFGYECGYRKWGFSTLEEFLKSLPDIVYLETLPGGRYRIHKRQSDDNQNKFRSTGQKDEKLTQKDCVPRFNKEPQNELIFNRQRSTFTDSIDIQKRSLSYRTRTVDSKESQLSFKERYTTLDSKESQIQAFSNRSTTADSKKPYKQYFPYRPSTVEDEHLQKQHFPSRFMTVDDSQKPDWPSRSTSDNTESKNLFPYTSTIDHGSQKQTFPYMSTSIDNNESIKPLSCRLSSVDHNELLEQEQAYPYKPTSVGKESPKQTFSCRSTLVDKESQKQSFSSKPTSGNESQKQSFPYTGRSTLDGNESHNHIFPDRTISNKESQKHFSYNSTNNKDLHESFLYKTKDEILDVTNESYIKSHDSFKISDKLVSNENFKKDFPDFTSLNVAKPTNLETLKNINYQEKERQIDSRSPSPTLSNGILIKGKLKAELRKILENRPEGVKASKLQAEYRQMYRKDLNLKEIGFFSIVELVSCVPDIVSLERPESMSDWILHDSRIHKSVYTFHAQPDAKTQMYDEDNPKMVKKSISPLSFKYLSSFKEEQGKESELCSPTSLDDDSMYSNVNHRQFKVPSDAIGFHINYSTLDSPKDIEYFEVYVSTVINPGKFWIQLRGEETSVRLLELMDYLEIVYNGTDSKNYLMPDTMIRIGQVCSAIYPNPVGEDDWHRAIITGIRDEDFVEVQYVDYGTVCSVPTSSLRMLKSQFLKFPMQAIPARLANLKPAVGEEWSKDATQVFMDFVREKPLLAKIMDSDNEILSLCLVDTSKEEDIHINDSLCNSFYAVHYNDYPSQLSESPNLNTESEILHLNTSHHSISNGEEKLKENNTDTTDEDEIFRQICEELEDELILENCERKYVKKVTSDGLTFHVINYEDIPYLASSEISSFLWKGDYVRAMLRMKRITVPSVVVTKDQCPELFLSFQNFNIKGVSDVEPSPEVVILYELSGVWEILKIFKHSSVKFQDAILEEINLYEAEDNYWMSSDSEKDDTDALIIDSMTTEELLVACQIFEACRSRILIAMTKHTKISDVNKLIDIEKQLEYIKKSLQSKPLLDQEVNGASSLSEGVCTSTTLSPNCFPSDLDIWSSSAPDKLSLEKESQLEHTTSAPARQQTVTSSIEVSVNGEKNNEVTPCNIETTVPNPSTVTPFTPRSIPQSQPSISNYTKQFRNGPCFNVSHPSSLPPGIKTGPLHANMLPPGINPGPVFQNPPLLNPHLFQNPSVFSSLPVFPNQPVYPNRPIFTNQSILPNQVNMYANQTSAFPNQPAFPNQNMFPNQTVYQNQFNMFANQSVLFPPVNSFPNF